MIPRTAENTIKELSQYFPVIAVTGPRQSGKTTLVQHVFPEKMYVSLENIDQMEMANDDPRGFLDRFKDGAILDEVQRAPKLFSYLQTIVDRDKRPGLFVLTGSQQFGLVARITQSLAGRVCLIHLLPFSIAELKRGSISISGLDWLMFHGLYPAVYDRNIPPPIWYANYIATYIERDVRQLLNIKDLSIFQRFLRMCAARTGQLLNLASLGNDCGISHNTVRAWLSVLEASYIVFLLYPHHKNFGKRLVKTPKLYFYDTGLAAWLLNVKDADHLSIHPMRGALFESLVLGEMLKARFNRGKVSNLFFWRNNLGIEIDVLIEKGDALVPVEVKSGKTITQDFFTGINKWQNIAGPSSKEAYLVYGGDQRYTRSGITIIPWDKVEDEEALL
ncbi:MAG: ATP-binding protein [Syntrophales bacterium]|nr:ATP-binding protein [Syntrophales bacterium]